MSNKTSDNVANIERLNNFANMTFLYGNRVNLNVSALKEIQNDIKNILSDYTRQKQINEEHKKLNGELRERVKDLEENNKTQIMSPYYVKENYIPKQAVIDKMEELNKEIKNSDEIDAIFKIKQQQVLQELLEGERK